MRAKRARVVDSFLCVSGWRCMCILFPYSIEELNETGVRVARPDGQADPAEVKKTGDSIKLFFGREQAARCWLLLWLLL